MQVATVPTLFLALIHVSMVLSQKLHEAFKDKTSQD